MLDGRVLQPLKQHEGVGLAPEGPHVGQVHLQLVHGLQRHEAPELAAASALCC